MNCGGWFELVHIVLQGWFQQRSYEDGDCVSDMKDFGGCCSDE